jgi:hypothetical protein
MSVIRLEQHEYPATPQHDLRGQSVLDSSGRYLGYVANLYVDEDERQLRFVDVLTRGFLGLGRTHHLVPIEALIPAEEAQRLRMWGAIELQADRETVERSPTFPNPLAGPDPEFEEAIRQHYGYG